MLYRATVPLRPTSARAWLEPSSRGGHISLVTSLPTSEQALGKGSMRQLGLLPLLASGRRSLICTHCDTGAHRCTRSALEHAHPIGSPWETGLHRCQLPGRFLHYSSNSRSSELTPATLLLRFHHTS